MGKVNREGQAHVLSKYEEMRVMDSLDPPWSIIFAIGIYTGERWGAIRQLDVKDVYAFPGEPLAQITFRSITRKQSAGKKPNTRQVYVHPTLRAILVGYYPRRDGCLFPGHENPTRPVTPQQCDYHLRQAVKKAGLEHLGISTHSTRRTFITRLANSKVPLHELKALTGHKSMDSLMRYIDGNPDTQRAAIMAL